MIGSLLAAHRRSPGARPSQYQGRTYNAAGMGSVSAMARGSADRYFQQDSIKDQFKLARRHRGQVPYKGPKEATPTSFLSAASAPR